MYAKCHKQPIFMCTLKKIHRKRRGNSLEQLTQTYSKTIFPNEYQRFAITVNFTMSAKFKFPAQPDRQIAKIMLYIKVTRVLESRIFCKTERT